MSLLILSDPDLLCDVKSKIDLFFPNKCNVYSKIETTESIVIGAGVTFHDNVKCRSFIVSETIDSPCVMQKDLICENFESGGDFEIFGDLVVDKTLSYSALFLHRKVFLHGVEVNEFPVSEKASGFRIACNNEKLFVPEKLRTPENSFRTKETEPDIMFIESEAEVLIGICEDCNTEKPVQTIVGHDGSRLSICYECATSLINPAQQTLPVVSKRRVPTAWEIANMSEEEKESYVKNGYVLFDKRTPSEPFISVTPEARDGVLKYKELSVCDPDGKYIGEDEAEAQTLRLPYNGGKTACLIQGTLSATSMYTCWAVLAAPFGLPVAAVAWVAMMPFTWKFSKKATNIINEAIILPTEIRKRQELIEARRKDEQINHEIHIETI